MMKTKTRVVDLGLDETGLDAGCRDCGPAHDGHGRDCGCSGGCSSGGIERPRWFTGQIVGPGDLEALQDWVLGRARRHNRLIHGWGISCGLAVKQTLSATGEAEPWSVTVTVGYALSACGDEVSVPAPVRIDIRQPRPSGSDVCAPPVDPWCASVRERRDPDRTYYLAIRYAEERRRPVRGGGCGCGCDDEAWEFSRIAETYALAVLSELPDCYDEEPQEIEYGERDVMSVAQGSGIRSGLTCTPEIRRTGTRSCPSCCSPWIVLADLRVDSAGTVTIDPLAHRRFLPALSELAFTCAPKTSAERTGFNEVERDLVERVFATDNAEVMTFERADVSSASAIALRGATASNALRRVIGDHTVAELAFADVDVLRAAVERAGGDPDSMDRVHAMATAAMRLAGGA